GDGAAQLRRQRSVLGHLGKRPGKLPKSHILNSNRPRELGQMDRRRFGAFNNHAVDPKKIRNHWRASYLKKTLTDIVLFQHSYAWNRTCFRRIMLKRRG